MLQAELGVDIGGTFTDVVLRGSDGSLRIAKVPSSRADPSAPMHTVLGETLTCWNVPAAAVRRLVHGTTVATNAVLERKGAKLGLLTTAGFTDVLEIGRQNRTQIYDLVLKPETPVFLAPGHLRKGVQEAIDPDGSVRLPLDEASLAEAVDDLVSQGVEAIAVCFLFSFVNDEHERQAAAFIASRHPDVQVSLSCDLDPAFREYERSVVTAFDAYVKPVLDRYLRDMEGRLAAAGLPAPLQIMHSRGGVNMSTTARKRPIRLFLSGPAAGVVGALSVGSSVGVENLITLDVGGTSSDIALIADGRPIIRSEGFLDGYRIRVPMVDVNAIGAGGGSIAWIDPGGGLRVGPHSAGAEPGPAAYGRGGVEATVTDASIVLGYFDPTYFAGGMLALDPALASAAIKSKVADPLGLSVEDAALGIHRVVTAQMAEGIRFVSISRGVDPRDFALVAFGGGGGLHATALARELGMKTILVPRFPGVLSAAGLLAAPIEHEAAIAFLHRFDATSGRAVLETCARLERECAARMAGEALGDAKIETLYYADVCYVGQAYHLEVKLDASDPDRLIERCFEAFVRQHEQIYGHATRSPARFVNLRAVQRAPFAEVAETPRPATRRRVKGERKVRLQDHPGPVATKIYDREGFAPTDVVQGPAIIEQADTTTLIEPGWTARVHAGGVLFVTREG